jgi:hypothetical protein
MSAVYLSAGFPPVLSWYSYLLSAQYAVNYLSSFLTFLHPSFNLANLYTFISRPGELLSKRLAESGAMSFASTLRFSISDPASGQILSSLQSLICRCLEADPSIRITAAAALQQIIQLSGSALGVLSRADNLLLPSPVLLFTFPPTAAAAATAATATTTATAAAAAEEELIVAEQQQQMRRIQDLCAQHGPIVRTAVVQAYDTTAAAATGSQLFVQFLSPQAAAKARILLTCPPPIPVTAVEKNYSGSESFAEKERCLYAQSPPRNVSDVQRGFLSEYYPLELWYKYVV